MSNFNWVLFFAASYGLCFGVMNDKIPFVRLLRLVPVGVDSEGKNFFARMFECPYCTGFHTGWMLFLVMGLPQVFANKSSWWEVLLGILCWGFASSAACYLLDTFAIWLERARER